MIFAFSHKGITVSRLDAANIGECRESVGKTTLRQKRWEQKNKMSKEQLEKESSTETKKCMRLKEKIKGTIRAINNNPSRGKPSVTY
jgi:hypothetical protein